MPTTPAVQEFVGPPRSPDSWEMVIPKTGRPGTRPARIPPPSAVKSIPAIQLGPALAQSLAAEPRVAEPLVAKPPAAKPSNVESEANLGLPWLGGSPQESHTRLFTIIKSALATLLVLVIARILFFPTSNPEPTPVVAETVEVGPTLPVGQAGWITDFAPLAGPRGPRRVSVLRASQKLTDFRLEFTGQIESKALGWVFRAKDPKNFYVMKLEITKPIPESQGVLTHFAVVNGQEQPRVQIPLSMPLRPNIAYTVRLDALGSSFTTWIQGQKVDQWTDAQIREGGAGIYSEQMDRGALSGDMTFFTLLAKPQSRR